MNSEPNDDELRAIYQNAPVAVGEHSHSASLRAVFAAGRAEKQLNREAVLNKLAETIAPGSVENFPAASPDGRVYLALAVRIKDAIESVYADIGATTDASVLASNAARFIDTSITDAILSASADHFFATQGGASIAFGMRSHSETTNEPEASVAELTAARIETQAAMTEVLVAHQRLDMRHCGCGWDKLGRSHAEHQAEMILKAAEERAAEDGSS